MRRAVALAVLAFAAACAPGTRGLLDAHDYAGAVCAGMRHPGERSLVLSALERDLAPALTLHAFRREELAAIFDPGETATLERIVSRVILVRVRAVQNGSNLGEALLDLEPRWRGQPLRKVAVDLDTFATLTGEHVPAARQVTVDTRPFDQRVREATLPFRELGSWGVEILTLGLLKIEVDRTTGPGTVRTYDESPQRAELELRAPRALALADVVTAAWERPAAQGSGALDLVVRAAFSTYGNEGTCVLTDEMVMPLGVGAPETFEDRVGAIFGERYRALLDLRAGAAHP